ncbi:hypothetical protein D3C86_1819960 [compost metagenome]
MRLDLLQAGIGALDVERVEFGKRNAIGKQCLLQRIDRVLAQGATAREFVNVPEIGPGIRAVGRVEAVGPVGHDGGIDVDAKP